jgi:hypothetical protein
MKVCICGRIFIIPGDHNIASVPRECRECFAGVRPCHYEHTGHGVTILSRRIQFVECLLNSECRVMLRLEDDGHASEGALTSEP